MNRRKFGWMTAGTWVFALVVLDHVTDVRGMIERHHAYSWMLWTSRMAAVFWLLSAAAMTLMWLRMLMVASNRSEG